MGETFLADERIARGDRPRRGVLVSENGVCESVVPLLARWRYRALWGRCDIQVVENYIVLASGVTSTYVIAVAAVQVVFDP